MRIGQSQKAQQPIAEDPAAALSRRKRSRISYFQPCFLMNTNIPYYGVAQVSVLWEACQLSGSEGLIFPLLAAVRCPI